MVTMNCVYDGRTDTVANFHSDSKKFSIKLSNLFGQSILTEVGKNLVLRQYNSLCTIVSPE